MTLPIRLMAPADLPAVMAVQTECYPPSMVEDEVTLRERLASASDFAWVAEDAQGVCAYLCTYPSLRGKITRLGAGFTVPATPDCLYLHDLAVAGRASGKAVGPTLVRTAWQAARARGWAYSALVSVQASQAFWERLGYRVCDDLAATERPQLDSYVGPACYMVKALATEAETLAAGAGSPA